MLMGKFGQNFDVVGKLEPLQSNETKLTDQNKSDLHYL